MLQKKRGKVAARWQYVGGETGLFRRYVIIFFVTVLFLVAMGITILLLDFSSDLNFVTYELDQMETNMVSAADRPGKAIHHLAGCGAPDSFHLFLPARGC